MYLLDTNIISYLLLQNAKVKNKIETINLQELVTCSIVVSELLYGVKLSGSKQFELISFYNSFFERIEVIGYDFSASKIFAEIKSDLKINGNIIEDFDLMIASICLANDLILVTNNTKDFERINGLKIENWTK